MLGNITVWGYDLKLYSNNEQVGIGIKLQTSVGMY
jgi:hypothetical protein